MLVLSVAALWATTARADNLATVPARIAQIKWRHGGEHRQRFAHQPHVAAPEVARVAVDRLAAGGGSLREIVRRDEQDGVAARRRRE